MARKKKNKPAGKKSKDKAGGQRKRRKQQPAKDLVNHRYMHALSKRDRVQILAILCERLASPKEIADELDIGLSQVSYHVQVLRDCGLIAVRQEVPRRGAIQHFYRAKAPMLIPPGTWKDLPSSVRKGISKDILQEFFEDASASMEAGVFDEAPGELSWAPLVLDAAGIDEFGKLARDFLAGVMELQANVSQRSLQSARKTDKTKAATVFLATFFSARAPKDAKKASATKRR